MKKLFLLFIGQICLISLSFSAQAIREHESTQQAKQNEIKEDAIQKDQGYGLSNYQLMEAYNAPGRINVKGNWDTCIYLEFLYKTAYQENMALARAVNNTTGWWGDKGYFVDTDWNAGFKIGLGLYTGHDNWQIYAEYMRYHNNTRTTVYPDNGFYLMPAYFYSNVGDSVSKCYAKWKLKMDFVDLYLSRAFYSGKNLIFTPQAGLRLTFIDQNLHGYYNVVGATTNVGTNVNSDSWALGPRFGMDGKWLLGSGFRLFTNAALSTLYTHYKLDRRSEIYYPNAINGVYTTHNTHNTFHYLRPYLETALGFGWGTYYANYNWHFDLTIGYQFDIYFNQNMLAYYCRYVDVSDYGDLYLHGFNLAMKFDF